MLKRLFFFIGLALSYILVKEFLILHQAARSLHPAGGYVIIGLLAAVLIYFVILPLIQIFVIPARLRPARDPDHIDDVARRRVALIQKNRMLRQLNLDWNQIDDSPDGFKTAVTALQPEADKIRKKYVTQVFYGTAVAQNGFLDAVIILSTATAMIRAYFMLYQGRVSNQEMLRIYKLVYLSMAIGGSEGVETATDEILSKLVASGVKSVPFAARLFGSVADGFVNATLMTRVAMVTENYCTRLFAESEQAFFPTLHAVVSATKTVTGDWVERIAGEMKKLAKEQTGQTLKAAVNPVKSVLSKAFDRAEDDDNLLWDEGDWPGSEEAAKWKPLSWVRRWLHT